MTRPDATLSPVDIPGDLGFTDEHALLRDTARRFLAESCPFSAVRGLVDDPVGYDPAVHAEMAKLGWTGLLVPEACGGAGLDLLSVALILEETGRVLLPGPLWSTLLAARAIEQAGTDEQCKRWLPAIAGGAAVATIALAEPHGSPEPDAVRATARALAGGEAWQLDGVKTHVLWAESAALIVAPFRLDSGDIALFVVDPGLAGVSIAAESSVDPTRRMARVTFDGVHLERASQLPAAGVDALRSVHLHGQIFLAAEMIGAAEAILGRTRDYACERIQFGRPIGSFQAVKHPLVNVLIAVEHARSLLVGAVATLADAPHRAEIPARMAKIAASQALRFAADRGVQLHGGFGFTWDCDAHFFFKRALWSAATLGDDLHHRKHIAAYLLD